ncbi:unnamed protein product [Withania somnifera]
MAENYHMKSDGKKGLQDAQVTVVMVPLPAQGHLNQLLHLSRLSSLYNIPVHYVGATTHIRQAKFRVHGFDPLADKTYIFMNFLHRFLKIPLQPVCCLVRHLLDANHRRVTVIFDSMMTWVVEDVPAILNAECYCFHSISAFHLFSLFWEIKGKPLQDGTELYKDILSLESCCTSEIMELTYNSSRIIDGLYLDLLAKECNGLNLQALGPFNPLLSEKNKNSNKHHKTLYWLGKQETNSVIHVSFGTSTSLSNKEIEELAIGLEKNADKGDVFSGEESRAQIPEGYEERIKERGIIVRDWAPQLDILAHTSTGGFMSHCGWNSCMESISMGVPIAAWPMHSDQPRNSQLVTKFLKIGLIVRNWARRDELVTSEIVENAVRTLMASPEGDEMRKRASELSNVVKQSVMDGGVNREEMDSFIAHITR